MTIKLENSDKLAIIDDADAFRVLRWRWFLNPYGYVVYCKNVKGKTITLFLNRFIMTAKEGMVVHHKNHNILDNCRSNLMICNQSQNTKHRIGVRGRRFKGVCWDKSRRKWKAALMVDYKSIHIGRFYRQVDAARAYDDAAIRLHGEFALTNKAMGRF